jgi:hypothetical protein
LIAWRGHRCSHVFAARKLRRPRLEPADRRDAHCHIRASSAASGVRYFVPARNASAISVD